MSKSLDMIEKFQIQLENLGGFELENMMHYFFYHYNLNIFIQV